MSKNFEFWLKSSLTSFMSPIAMLSNLSTMKISLMISSTGADESLFQGMSIYKEPMYENLIEKGRLLLLMSSLILSCLKDAFWMFILPVQKASSTFSSPVKN